VAVPAADALGGLQLSPGNIVAPLNANVILVAGVYGPARKMLAGQPVQWALAPGSVGQIHSVGRSPRGIGDLFVVPPPVRSTPTTALAETFNHDEVISRGTNSPADALTVLRGQTWISVISATEGAMYVTAVAPELPNPAARQQTALIHWVDARWTAPPPAISPAGTQRTLITTVNRQITGAPLPGWRVHYEVAGGPAAGFAPDGKRSIDVTVNEAGQASAELVQSQPEQGINTIAVQLIHPATAVAPVPGAGANSPAPNNDEFTVGAVTTQQTWAAPPTGVQLRLAGPERAAVGSEVHFDLTITNYTAAEATGLVLTDRYDDGLVHAAATNPIQRELDPIPPGQSRQVTIIFRVAKPGRLCHTVDLAGSGGLHQSAQACLQADGPQPVLPPGAAPLPAAPLPAAPPSAPAGVPPALPQPATPAVPPLLPPSAPATPPPAAPPASLAPPPAAPVVPPANPALSMTIKTTGPQTLHVGETAEFVVEVRNSGGAVLPTLRITDSCDPQALRATEADDGIDRQIAIATGQLVWTVQNLAAGQSVQRRIHCLCLAPSASACNQATATDGASLTAGDQACIAILAAQPATPATPPASAPPAIAPPTSAAPPAGGNLHVEIAARTNPIAVGSESSYQITITNDGPGSERKVALSATLPDDMQFTDNQDQSHAKATIDGQTIRFEPIAELRAKETLTFNIRVKASRSGDATVRAEVTSQGRASPLTADTATHIFSEP